MHVSDVYFVGVRFTLLWISYYFQVRSCLDATTSSKVIDDLLLDESKKLKVLMEQAIDVCW